MATIATPIATPVFAPKGFVAKFKDRTADGIADLLIKQVALPLDATIKARNIVLSKDDAVALTSSAYNALTFAKGVAHRLALFAGGKSLAEVQKDLPQMAQEAIVAGAAGLKMGAGLTVSGLRNAVSVGIAHVMALPVKTIAKEKPAQVAVSTFAAVAHALPLALVVEAQDGRNMRDALPHGLTDSERASAYQALVDVPRAIAEAEAVAKAEAEAEAVAKAEAEAVAKAQAEKDREAAYIAGLVAAGKSRHLRAVAFCDFATELGIKLTAAQLKALDAYEGKKEVA